MKTIHILEAPEVANVHKVSVRALHENEHVQVMVITLQPGEALRRHITPVDVFFYVLEGTGIVELGDERQEVTAGTLIDSPARIPHRLRNDSDQLTRFMVVKTPRPTEGTAIL